MWIFLFLLASVPMVYYWSDNIVTMFPQVEGYLPKSDKPAVVPPKREGRFAKRASAVARGY